MKIDYPNKPARWQRFGLDAFLRASEGSIMALMPLRRRMIDDMTMCIMSRKQCHQQSRLGTSAIGISGTCDGVAATTAFLAQCSHVGRPRRALLPFHNLSFCESIQHSQCGRYQLRLRDIRSIQRQRYVSASDRADPRIGVWTANVFLISTSAGWTSFRQ
jgi:hypothetical protein